MLETTGDRLTPHILGAQGQGSKWTIGHMCKYLEVINELHHHWAQVPGPQSQLPGDLQPRGLSQQGGQQACLLQTCVTAEILRPAQSGPEARPVPTTQGQ